jgi:hypothetical protein
VSHDWGNNTITIQGIGTVRTIHVTKKLGAPTKHPEVLVCYDFHFGIFDEDEDLMFAIEPGLFSIGTIVVLTSTCLNLVKQVIKPMFESPISFDILAKLVPFTTCQDSYTP